MASCTFFVRDITPGTASTHLLSLSIAALNRFLFLRTGISLRTVLKPMTTGTDTHHQSTVPSTSFKPLTETPHQSTVPNWLVLHIVGAKYAAVTHAYDRRSHFPPFQGTNSLRTARHWIAAAGVGNVRKHFSLLGLGHKTRAMHAGRPSHCSSWHPT